MIQPYKCEICRDTDEHTMILDDNQGTMICLGADGLGCGGVVLENRFTNTDTYWEGHPDEYYSPQAMFTSNTINDHKFQRLNNMIEKNLSRYLKEDTVTGDQYKNFHRDEAYGILDQVGIMCQVDKDIIRNIKYMFHELRTRMSRIHKLEMALCCLFYLELTLS